MIARDIHFAPDPGLWRGAMLVHAHSRGSLASPAIIVGPNCHQHLSLSGWEVAKHVPWREALAPTAEERYDQKKIRLRLVIARREPATDAAISCRRLIGFRLRTTPDCTQKYSSTAVTARRR